MKYTYPMIIALHCLLSLPAFSQTTQEKMDKGFKYCDSLYGLAESIMDGRQSGTSQKMMTALMKGLGADAAKLVEFAYNYPKKDTEKERKELVRLFSETTRQSCRKSVLENLKSSK